MAIEIGCFLSVFLMICSAGLLILQRKSPEQKVRTVISDPALVREARLMSTIQEAGVSIGGMVGHFENVIPKTQAEVSILRQRLMRAGYRNDSAVSIFYGGKFLLMIVMVVLVFATRVASYNYAMVVIAALAFGFLAPDFWLGRQITSRQRKLKRGLPDVLDLLVVCVEAGLSLDQATARTAEELELAAPALCDELRIVVLEQRAGCPRADAWKHMADRTDLDVVKNLVSMLVQSEQFGTSIAKTLRVHSDTYRTKRVQQIEEMAAKTTIKILFPLVVFIFPSLFLVVLGPAMILMFESFQNGFGH
jgi:tight adherence protein C